MTLVIYIGVMALTTYLIRMLPFTLFRKQIRSRFFKDLVDYLPYAVLTAMTFPAVFYSTGNTTVSLIGTGVALVLAYCRLPMVAVAAIAAGVSLVAGLFIH